MRFRLMNWTPSIAAAVVQVRHRLHAWRQTTLYLISVLFTTDYEHPENINVNDALGNYSLSLIDSLDTLALMGNWSEFRRAVRIVSGVVSFDQDTVVQVFESTIRVMGGLLSAHLIAR